MKRMLALILAVFMLVGMAAVAEEASTFEPLHNGNINPNVRVLQKTLRNLGYNIGAVDSVFGPKTEAGLKELQAALGWEQSGIINTEEELNVLLSLSMGDGINVANGTSNQWSDWMTPAYDAENSCFTIAYAYPGERQVGDTYTCHVEVEFADVTATEGQAFGFTTQGAVDGGWNVANIWTPSFIKLTDAPSDGVYSYTYISFINEGNADAVKFDLGFRCDYWASGAFRVRNLKVEKGARATEWSASSGDTGDGVNVAVDTSAEWSDWVTPENGQNKNFTLAVAYPGEKKIGDAFTCQVEVEFADVAVEEGQTFGFMAQGAVDDGWDIANIWNGSLVQLKQAPENGVYTFTATSRITDKNVDAVKFNLGFRCDYWAAGSFRVRNIKVEKGIAATAWTPAPEAVGQ